MIGLLIGLWMSSLEQSVPPDGLLSEAARWGPKAVGSITDRTWSPDHKRIAYILREQNPNSQSNTDWVRETLCVARADGSGARRIVEGGPRWDRSPEIAKWAPDSRHVLYWSNVFGAVSVNADGNPLWDVDIRSKKRRELSKLPGGKVHSFVLQWPELIQFSPNGEVVLIVVGGSRFWYDHKRIRRLDYRTGKGRWLTAEGQTCIWPEWSPDGRTIAYTMIADNDAKSFESGAQSEVWVMNADGLRRRRLASSKTASYYCSEWSGDGRQLNFTREDDSGQRSRWKVSSEGKGLRKVRDLPKDEEALMTSYRN
ncbi:MAG: PD40 domain-containing protein [Armatimonadetes bacterium]|nr:PD40 domain-containing protein [Armatimonadota bacterium]